MARYLLNAVYKPEAVMALAKNPQNRVDVVREVVQKLGGKLEGGGITFGDYDPELVCICELPDNVAAAALSLAINAGGMVKAIKTVPLISGSEALDAMTKASNAGYRPPGI